MARGMQGSPPRASLQHTGKSPAAVWAAPATAPTPTPTLPARSYLQPRSCQRLLITGTKPGDREAAGKPAAREASEQPQHQQPCRGSRELRAGSPSRRAYPGGEISFGLEVLPIVLVALEVAQVGLEGEGGEEEISLLAQHALGVQHLLPQVPVVVVACRPVAAGREGRRGELAGHLPTTQARGWETTPAPSSRREALTEGAGLGAESFAPLPPVH